MTFKRKRNFYKKGHGPLYIWEFSFVGHKNGKIISVDEIKNISLVVPIRPKKVFCGRKNRGINGRKK